MNPPKHTISIIDLAVAVFCELHKITKPFHPMIRELFAKQNLYVPVPSWLHDLAFIAYVEAF